MIPIQLASPAAPRGRRRVPPMAFGVLVVAVFAGTIGVGMATGAWQTTGRTTGSGERIAPQGESASEVKGWMAIGDVAEAWEIPLAEMLAAFDLPADTPPVTPLKELESEGFEVSALRTWLAERATGSDPVP
jgi:hypothetical protein